MLVTHSIMAAMTRGWVMQAIRCMLPSQHGQRHPSTPKTFNSSLAQGTQRWQSVGSLTNKWTFSTNGVSIQGRYGIPCVGFGPGAESQAHAPNEVTWKQDLVNCAALYAAVPALYKLEKKVAVTQFRQELTGNEIK
jgi:acetylornithine deacetylase/succinyl-diaminopimelate desuccinylase-like protein